MIAFLAYLFPTVCAVIAGLLAWKGREGWGWFLLVAALTIPAVTKFIAAPLPTGL